MTSYDLAANPNIDSLANAISETADSLHKKAKEKLQSRCAHTTYVFGHSESNVCLKCLEGLCSLRTCLDCGKEK